MQYFNIQVASQISGVASATIRAWEKRYKAVVPERAENKHRLYSEKDIEKLALLFKLTEFGQSIGKIAHLELDHLKQIYSTLMHRPYDEKQVIAPQQDKVDFSKVLTNIQLALSAFKMDIISHELTKTRELMLPREFCLKLLVPLLKETQTRVTRHELTLAHEHALRTLSSIHIGEMIVKHLQNPPTHEDTIIIVGTELPSLLCIHYNLKFINLGAMAAAALVTETAQNLRAKAILIDPIQFGEDYVQELQQNISGGIETWAPQDMHALDRYLEQKQKSFNATGLLH